MLVDIIEARGRDGVFKPGLEAIRCLLTSSEKVWGEKGGVRDGVGLDDLDLEAPEAK